MLTQEEQIAAAGLQYTTPTTTNPDFLSTLQEKLMSQTGMISSTPTNIDTAIQGAINNTTRSTASTGAAITSSYDRNISYTAEQNTNQITAARERGVGVNTSDVAYKALASEADKQLKDLEQRKQELLLQNDAAGAAKVSELILTGQKMKQDAMKTTFDSLLSTANLGLNIQAGQRAQKAQDFTQRQAIASIGLEYGIPVSENDTIESIIAKAAPTASKEKQAQLALTLANTRRAQAEAAKAEREGKVTANLNDPVNRQAYISMALTSPDVFNKLMVDNPKLVDIRNDAQKLQTERIKSKVTDLVMTKTTDYATVKAAVESDQSLGAQINILENDKTLLEAYNAALAEKKKQVKPKSNYGSVGEALLKFGTGVDYTSSPKVF